MIMNMVHGVNNRIVEKTSNLKFSESKQDLLKFGCGL